MTYNGMYVHFESFYGQEVVSMVALFGVIINGVK